MADYGGHPGNTTAPPPFLAVAFFWRGGGGACCWCQGSQLSSTKRDCTFEPHGASCILLCVGLQLVSQLASTTLNAVVNLLDPGGLHMLYSGASAGVLTTRQQQLFQQAIFLPVSTRRVNMKSATSKDTVNDKKLSHSQVVGSGQRLLPCSAQPKTSQQPGPAQDETTPITPQLPLFSFLHISTIRSGRGSSP